MKAGKEKTKCLLEILGKCSVKASVKVQGKGIKCESPTRQPLIEDGKAEKPACWMEEMAVSM